MPLMDGVELDISLRAALPVGSPLSVGLSGNFLRLSGLKHKCSLDHRMFKHIDIEDLPDMVMGRLVGKDGS